MSSQPTSKAQEALLTKPFLGNIMEQCIVTRDHKSTLAKLCNLGIGPWRIYTFTPSNTQNQTYHGRPSPFRLKVCFAELPGSHNEAAGQVYEVIEPLSTSADEPNIFDEWLRRNGDREGVHHIAYDLNGIEFDTRHAEFESRGFRFVQGGSWLGKNHFAFFEAEKPENDLGTVFETIAFPDDWVYPEPDEWFPYIPAHW